MTLPPGTIRHSGKRHKCALAPLLFACSIALAGSGCALPPTAKPVNLAADPALVPENWVAAPKDSENNNGKTGTPETGQNTAQLQGDIYGVVDDDTARALIAEALNHNADLKAAAHRLKSSQWLLRPVVIAGRPRIDASLGLRRTRTEFTDTSVTGNAGEYGIGVQWPIDLWGKLAADSSAAREDFAAQEADYEAARLSLGTMVLHGWVAVWSLDQEVSITLDRREALEQLHRIAQSRYRRGLAPFGEVDFARTQVEITRAEIATAREAALNARRDLEVLLGRYPSGTLHGPNFEPKITMPRIVTPAKALARRPDVQASYRRLLSSAQSSRSGRLALLPDITLSGSLQRSQNQDTLLGDITQWSLFGIIEQVLFDHGARRAEALAQSEEQKARQEEYRQLVLSAMGEVEAGLTQAASLETQHTALSAAFNAALRDEATSRSRYLSGISDARTMIQSRVERAQIQASLLQVTTARLNGRLQLGLALGIGFPEK